MMKTKRNLSIFFSFLFMVSACGSQRDPKRADQAELRYRVAQKLLLKGENTRAMSELLQAEKLDPKNPEVQNLLGLMYVQRSMFNKAEEYFRKAVSIDRHFSEAHNHICALLIQREAFEEAIAECTKAVGNLTYLTPERAYHNMGYAYERMGKEGKAIETYRKGLLHNKNFVMSRKSLGLIFLRKNKLQAASKEFEVAREACQASPEGVWGRECPESYYRLAMIYVRLKHRTKARKVFRECVEADKNGEYGRKCKENLRTLE